MTTGGAGGTDDGERDSWAEPSVRPPSRSRKFAQYCRTRDVMRQYLLGAALAVALLIGVPLILTAPLPSGSIRDVADRFEPEGYETVSDGTFEPRRILCLGDNACPSVSRHWVFDAPFTTAELQAWLDAAGYDATVGGDCATSYCDAFGSSAGWTVLVLVGSPSAQGGQVQLSLYFKG